MVFDGMKEELNSKDKNHVQCFVPLPREETDKSYTIGYSRLKWTLKVKWMVMALVVHDDLELY